MGEFRKITDKPLKGIIYTHYHGDHIQGTKVFFEPGTPVYAHENFMKEFKLHASRGKTAAMRAGAMFGLIMPSERIPMVTAFPVPGGSHLMWEVLKPEDFVWPTVTFRDKHSFRLGGLTFNLFHAPGETPDQIMVDVPELQFVCCADNYYASFPNLYTIRGTSYRRSWIGRRPRTR
jgi:glyoxylase-like metal-dependent hydrolase (beta-lactamase superfamily II)